MHLHMPLLDTFFSSDEDSGGRQSGADLAKIQLAAASQVQKCP